MTTAIQTLADGTVRKLPLPDDTANLGPGAWSPDGTTLALQLWDDTDHTRDGIYTVRTADGGGLQRLTHAQIADIPADYSPDGTKLIVFRDNAVQSVGTLSILDLRSGQLKPLWPKGMEAGFGTVRYAPDGKTILLQESRMSTTGALWRIQPDGRGLTKVFEDAEGRFVSTPTWSPDGSMIMFALNPVADDFQHQPNGIYVIDADGSNLRFVLGGNDFKREPEWRSPRSR
jgi:Tol biopolymer transport system component